MTILGYTQYEEQKRFSRILVQYIKRIINKNDIERKCNFGASYFRCKSARRICVPIHIELKMLLLLILGEILWNIKRPTYTCVYVRNVCIIYFSIFGESCVVT